MKRTMHAIPTVRMVHVCPPIVVHTDPSSFRTTVQSLTGFKRKSTEPDNDRFDKATKNYAPFYRDNGFYEDHLNVSHCEESYDHINTLDGDCPSYGSCNSDFTNDQTDPCLIDSIYADCDELIMGSDGSLSPKWATPSSSNDSLMSQQHQQNTRVWDSQEEYCRMFACSANRYAYVRKSSISKKLKLEYAGGDLQPADYELMSMNFMDTFSMQEEPLSFLHFNDEHSSHHLL